MYCKKCGAEIDDEAMFCPKCGNTMDNSDSSININNADIKTEKKELLDSKQRMIRIISIAVIAISAAVIIFTAVLRYMVPGPESTVKQFFKACNEVDFSGILGCLDPSTAKEYKIAVDLLGGLSGLGIDSESVSDLGGMFSEFNDVDMRILDMQTEYIINGEKKKEDLFEIQKLTASDAEIYCTYMMSGEEQSDTFELHKYNGKWKIKGEYAK
jgi:hypothetical protein